MTRRGRLGGEKALPHCLLATAVLFASGTAGAVPGSYTIQTKATTYTTGSILELNCNYLNVQGELNVVNGQIKSANDITITGGQINGGSGTINAGGNWFNNGKFVAGTGTVVFTGQCATAPVQVTGNNQFCNLTLGSGQNLVFPQGQSTVVNCNLDLGSGNTLTSSGKQTAVIVLGPGATVSGDAKLDNVVIGPPQPTGMTPVPTLSEYALMLLSMLLAGSAATQLRRRRLPATGARRPPES